MRLTATALRHAFAEQLQRKPPVRRTAEPADLADGGVPDPVARAMDAVSCEIARVGEPACAAAPARAAWSALVTICRGRPECPPLFCVHGAGGSVLNFRTISDRLGARQPCYGLQAQGIDGHRPPLTAIESMAAQYVDAIRSAQPDGPYRLLGYSAGGVIAFEMAQQLKRAGAQIALLAMIDTLAPDASDCRISVFRKIWLARQWTLQYAVQWPARRRNFHLGKAASAAALAKVARGEPLSPELTDLYLVHNFDAAQRRYRPDHYDGSMLLFKAEQANLDVLNAGRSLGWAAHIRGDIRVVSVAGAHLSIMSGPGLAQVVEELRKELARPEVERPLRR